jgi:carbon-monoxide dehydrogenase medium subunit
VSRSIPFVEPSSLAAALAVLAEHREDARPVAGATAVTILLRQRLIEPGVLVALHRIPELRELDVQGGVLRLGALVRHRDVELSTLVRSAVPVLAHAFGQVGNVRVRNAATVGGVVAEADYASDPPSVLRALDAEVEVAAAGGARRRVPIGEFLVGYYQTALAPDELVTAVLVPVPDAGTRWRYTKFRTRSSEDRPCVGVTALVRTGAGGACEDVRVAVGAATELPLRLPEAERGMLGQPVTEAAAAELADAYAAASRPLDDLRGSAWYRREMIRVLVRRTLLEAAAGERSA